MLALAIESISSYLPERCIFFNHEWDTISLNDHSSLQESSTYIRSPGLRAKDKKVRKKINDSATVPRYEISDEGIDLRDIWKCFITAYICLFY